MKALKMLKEGKTIYLVRDLPSEGFLTKIVPNLQGEKISLDYGTWDWEIPLESFSHFIEDIPSDVSDIDDVEWKFAGYSTHQCIRILFEDDAELLDGKKILEIAHTRSMLEELEK